MNKEMSNEAVTFYATHVREAYCKICEMEWSNGCPYPDKKCQEMMAMDQLLKKLNKEIVESHKKKK